MSLMSVDKAASGSVYGDPGLITPLDLGEWLG
jgi:hypothetical protein